MSKAVTVHGSRRARVVYVNAFGETWVFDVCTNTRANFEPVGTVAGFVTGGLAYDVDLASLFRW